MPILEKQEVVNYSLDQVYTIISDVESYPKFLPWCSATRIKERIDNNTFTAELMIKFAVFHKSYVSKVTLSPPDTSSARVNAEMISGPFEHLSTSWQLVSVDALNTQIYFSLDFEFSSSLLGKIANSALLRANEKMLLAFKQRAAELYHANKKE